MAIKVLVTEVGQHLIAEVKQIENKETQEVVGYWLSEPRVIVYNRNEEGSVNIGFANYCLVSDENEFSIKADHVVSILEPRADVASKYHEVAFSGDAVTNEEQPIVPNDEVENESSVDIAADGGNSNSAD